MNIELTKREQQFIGAYFETIDFTEGHYAQLDDEFMRESTIDCLAFYQKFYPWLSDDDLEQAGHDFWLTRNGHGAGFWDGDWDNEWLAERMDKFSRAMGEVDAVYEEMEPAE